VLRSAVVTLALLAACRHDPGPQRGKRIPKPDNTPALRGGGAPRSTRITCYTLDGQLDASRHQIKGSGTLV
jgi:hypothetical protein